MESLPLWKSFLFDFFCCQNAGMVWKTFLVTKEGNSSMSKSRALVRFLGTCQYQWPKSSMKSKGCFGRSRNSFSRSLFTLNNMEGSKEHCWARKKWFSSLAPRIPRHLWVNPWEMHHDIATSFYSALFEFFWQQRDRRYDLYQSVS